MINENQSTPPVTPTPVSPLLAATKQEEGEICERCGEYTYDCTCPLEEKETDVNAGDPSKQKWPEFVCRYYHDGKWWGLNITARDWEDARQRVAKLGNLQLEGKLMMTIPAYSTKSAWLPNLICRIRNFFYGDR